MKREDLYPEDAEQIKEKEYYSLKKPFLITRYGEAFLDAIIFLLLTVGLFFAGRATLYQPFGHTAAVNFVHERLAESSLYVEALEGYYDRTDTRFYDEALSPEENLEYPILYYYTNFDYPRENKKLNAYFSAKKEATSIWKAVSSESYSLPKGTTIEEIKSWMTSHYERSEEATSAMAKKWLSEQYAEATYFLEHEPAYIAAANKAVYIDYFVVLIAELLAWGFYYVLLPMLLHGKTLFKIVFRMGLADKYTDQEPKKIQVFVREFVFLLLCIVLPTTWYFLIGNGIGYLAFIFPLAEIFVTGILSKANTSIHDLLSHTYVISTAKSAADIVLEQKK